MKMQLQNLAMVPVRGTVYVVKLPFVYVWKILYFLYSCLYAVFATILSVPVFYIKKAHNRLVLTWTWSKLFVRQSLGLSNSKTPGISDGTPTLQPRDYLVQPYSGSLAEEDDPFSLCRRRGSKSSKRQRKAMITHLLRLLLEPTSPVESEDETEKIPAARSAEQDEAEKALGLILDLVKLSKSETGARDPSKAAPALKPEELEAILRRAKDKEHLQALITELDQLAIDVDPARKTERVSLGRPSPSHVPCEPERPSSTSSTDLTYTPNNPSSVVSSSDEYMDPMDDEELEDISEKHLYNYGGLSPVQESPEYLTASSESLKMNQLEDELTKALSNLTTAASDLNADQEMVESMETQITQKTVTVTQSVVADNDLESVPKTTPQLGVQVGHDKRQLANARKPRPPSRRPQNNDSPTNQQSDNACQEGQGDLHSSDSEDDDAIIKLEKGKSPETKPPLGGVRVLPPLQLVDQIQLLTSGSKNWPTDQSVPEDDDGDEPSSEPAESKIRKASLSRQDSASSDTEKMKISSNQPPWIEMVLRRKRSNSSTSSNPSADAPVVVYEPPPRKTRVNSESQVTSLPQSEQKEDNIWNRDPALDVTTGLYDTLQPKPAEPVYLHERIAAQQGAFSVEPSPQLPPRNNLAIKRTASEETVMKPSSERAVRRRGSERHSSRESRKDKEFRSSSSGSSSRSRDSSKDKPTRESRSKDKGTHESRSREKDGHHRSRHHSHSAERSEHRHSSSHRSRSGDRSSSHSNERRSSHHHSSSDKHRSSSSDKHHSISSDKHHSSSRDKHSSTPKTPRETSSRFKILSSPHSSRSKLSTSLFSRSSPKDKDDKQKEAEKRKSKSEDSKKTRSGSEKISKSRKSSSENESSPGSGGMPRSTSSASIRSAGAASVYSFDSVISNNNTDL